MIFPNYYAAVHMQSHINEVFIPNYQNQTVIKITDFQAIVSSA